MSGELQTNRHPDSADCRFFATTLSRYYFSFLADGFHEFFQGRMEVWGRRENQERSDGEGDDAASSTDCMFRRGRRRRARPSRPAIPNQRLSIVSASDNKSDPAGTPKPRGPIVFSCPFLRIRKDKVSGGAYPTGDYYVLERPDSVSVLPVTPSGRTVLLRQERHPLAESTWELPGGHVDAGETAEAAARRELREETGLVGGALKLLSWHYPIAGLAASRTSVFAVQLDEAALDGARAEPGMDEIVELRIVVMPSASIHFSSGSTAST